MPFAGGIFTRLHRWVGDLNTSAQLFDNDGDDVAAALSNCVLRDGSGNPSADIPWNNHKITALATAAQDDSSQQAATTAFVVGQAGTASPAVAGTAAPGTSLRYARQDHVHPTDTTRMAVANNLGEVPNPALARAHIGAAASGANADISSMSGLGSLSSDLSIVKSSPALTLAASAAGQLVAFIGSVAGKLQWLLSLGDGTANNNFAVFRYNALGTFVDQPIVVSGVDGRTTFSLRPTWGGATPYDTGNFNSGVVTGALGYTPVAPGANSNITSLSGLATPLSIAQGGTGAATTAGARAAMGAAASGANTDITSLANLSPLSVAQGGTGGNLSNWTSFTTTISTTGGSGMSVTDNGSQYLLMGKLLFIKYDFSLSFSTPPTTLNVNFPAGLLVPLSWAFAGSNRSTGEALSVYNISSSQLTLTRYDATAPAGTTGSGTRTFSVTGMCLVQ